MRGANKQRSPGCKYTIFASTSAILALCLAAVVCPSAVQAQTSTGEINITVLDPSGAVVPGATVRVTGAETGSVARELTTNAEGIAAVPLLRPMTYTISVTATGFRERIQQGVVLRVGSTVKLQMALETGSVSEQITVSGEAALLEQSSGAMAQVLSDTTIAALPLNGRNYLALGNLLAGAVPSRSRDTTFAMYGNSGIQNAFVLDGGRNQNYLRGMDTGAGGGNPVVPTRDAYRPPLGAIAEFSVNSSNYSAEYGASAGAVVLVVTKSGTNQIHGSAHEYYQSSSLNARNFFAAPGPKPLLVYNQFGGSLGGPIVKNRAWIFGAYEGTGSGGATTYRSVVPTAAQRSGSFGSTRIYDPFSTVANPAGSGYVRTLYPNNTIPASAQNSMGKNLASLYPLPNLEGALNYGRNAHSDFFNHNMILRADTQLSSRSSMFGRLSFARYKQTEDAAIAPPAGAPAERFVPSWGVTYGYTHTLSPTTVNELRFSWTRITVRQDEIMARDEIIPGLLDPRVTSGIPRVAVTGFPAIGGTAACCSNSPLRKSSAVWDFADNVSKSWGKHLLKFGVDIMYNRPTSFATATGRGGLTFSGVFTQDPQSRPGTGNPLADLLVGVAARGNNGSPLDVIERGHYAGGYFQDNFTVTRSLTLNLGVRYEVFFPYIETRNRMGNFILDKGDPHFGQLILAGNPDFPRSLQTTDYNNFAGRLGFAYKVPGARSLAVRGGYGIFYAQDIGSGPVNRPTANPPFYGYGAVTINSDSVFPKTGVVLGSGVTFPRLAEVSASQFKLDPLATSSLTSYPLQYTTPYVQQWNLTIEKEFPLNLLWRTSYVGNRATNLFGYVYNGGNQPLTGGPGSVTTRRPLAKYTVAPINNYGYWNRSHYHGLSTEVRRQLSQDVSFWVNFTYGKVLDLFNPAVDLWESGYQDIQNAYDLDSLLGPSDNDVPLRLTFNGIWNLPFGPGHRLAGKGWRGAVIGNWRVNVIYAASSGIPFTPNLSFDNVNNGMVSWPNRTCNGNLSNWTLTRQFDTSCFPVPAQYQYGNTGRNILRGPGLNNFDFGVHRVFPIPVGEQTRLEFRGEFFNLPNHPQFSTPGRIIGTPSAGVISSTSMPNRVVQFGLKLGW